MSTEIVYAALGVLLFILSGEIATLMNRVSVRLYEIFPKLKSLPRSRFAGTQQNYKTMFYTLRIVGALMALTGAIFVWLTLLHRPNQTPPRTLQSLGILVHGVGIDPTSTLPSAATNLSS